MLENSIFYTSTDKENLKNIQMNAKECLETGLINKIIQEPPLGASKGPEDMSRIIKINIINELSSLNYISKRKLIRNSQRNFRKFRRNFPKFPPPTQFIYFSSQVGAPGENCNRAK